MVSEFELDANWKISGVKIGDKKVVKTDFVILSVGIKPNTSLLIQNGAEHIKNGALIVNEFMETSIKDVFAAGDNVAIKNLQTNVLYPHSIHISRLKLASHYKPELAYREM